MRLVFTALLCLLITGGCNVSQRSTSVDPAEDVSLQTDAGEAREDEAYFWYATGIWSLMDGDFAMAEESLLRAFALDPSSKTIRLKLTRLHEGMYQFFLANGDLPNALIHLEKAVLAMPHDARLQFDLAKFYGELGRMDKAIEGYENILKQRPGWIEVYYKLIALYGKQKDVLKMEALLKRFLQQVEPPEIKADILRRIGLSRLLYYRQTQADQDAFLALDSLCKIAAVFPDAPDLSGLYRDTIILGIGSADDAVRICEHYLAQHTDGGPGLLDLHMALGELYEGSGETNKAVQIYQELIEKTPANELKVKALQCLFRVYNQQDNLAGALGVIEKEAARFPDDHNITLLLAMIYKELDRPQDMIQVLEDAQQRNPNAPDLLIALGQSYGSIAGSEEKGIQVLSEFLEQLTQEQDPHHRLAREIRLALSLIYDNIGKTEEAIRELQAILEKIPKDPVANNNLGYLYATKGIHLAEAEGMIRLALEVEPDKGVYLDSLGWVLFKQGKVQDALVHLERAAERENDVVVLDHLAQVYIELDQNEKALESLQKALELDPDAAYIHEKVQKLQDLP